MIDDDLALYFDAADFAVPCVRQRPATADLSFAGIVSAVDEDMLQGHVSAAERRLRCAATVELLEGDVIVASGTDSYRVLAVRLVVDGREADALLAKVAT